LPGRSQFWSQLAVSGRSEHPGGSLAVVIVGGGRVALGGVPEQPADLSSHALEDGIKAAPLRSAVPGRARAGLRPLRGRPGAPRRATRRWPQPNPAHWQHTRALDVRWSFPAASTSAVAAIAFDTSGGDRPSILRPTQHGTRTRRRLLCGGLPPPAPRGLQSPPVLQPPTGLRGQRPSWEDRVKSVGAPRWREAH